MPDFMGDMRDYIPDQIKLATARGVGKLPVGMQQQTVADPGFNFGNFFSNNASTLLSGGLGGGLALGGTLLGLGSAQPEVPTMPTLPFDKDSIDALIQTQRRAGVRNIGSQLSGANIAAAGNMASRGLGSSTMTTSALGANRAAALQARGQLEADLSQQEMQMMQQLHQMQLQQQMAQYQAQAAAGQQESANYQQIGGQLANLGVTLLADMIPGGNTVKNILGSLV